MPNLKKYLMGTVLAMAGATASMTGAIAEEIGFVLAGPDIFYATEAELFTDLAETAGHSVTVANSEYKPSKELANVEDFIARGVDIIVLLSGNAESGTQAAKRAKEAGIPIFFVSALPSPAGYDIPTGIVSGDWIGMGETLGNFVGKNHAGEKIVMIEGFYGQGTTELIHKGFEQGLAQAGGTNKIVMNASGEWSRKGGLKVAQDFIASSTEFSVIYAMNEEMMAGTIQALKEAGKLGDYALYSANGKEIGWQWMKDGIMNGTIANPPTLEADLIFQMVQAHLDGVEYPRHVYNIQPMLTADNVDGAVPWDIPNYKAMKADGRLVVDLHKQKSISSMVVWDPASSSN